MLVHLVGSLIVSLLRGARHSVRMQPISRRTVQQFKPFV